MFIFSLRNILLGIVATLTMDTLTTVSVKLRLLAPLPPRFMGRWFVSVARGRVVHADIGHIAPINYEMAIAVPVHYGIGVTLALVYLFASSSLGLTPRNPVAAFGFALGTSFLPWLLMFPAMGYGWFGAHGPEGTRLFQSSLVCHFFYGVGLWLGVSLLI